MLLDADVSGGTSARWISAEGGVLTLLDSTVCCVKDALAGGVAVLFPAASDSPRSFSLHFLAGDSLAFAWPDGVSFREPVDSGSFESGKGYELSFQEVGDGVFSASRTTTGLASRSLVDLAVYEEKDGKAEKTDDAVAKKSEVGGIVTARQYTDLWDLENGETIRLYFALNEDTEEWFLSNIEGWEGKNEPPSYPVYYAGVSDTNITSVTLYYCKDSISSIILKATRQSKNALGLAFVGDGVSEFANDAGYLTSETDPKFAEWKNGADLDNGRIIIGNDGDGVTGSEAIVIGQKESATFQNIGMSVTGNDPVGIGNDISVEGPGVAVGACAWSRQYSASVGAQAGRNASDSEKGGGRYAVNVGYFSNSLDFGVSVGYGATALKEGTAIGSNSYAPAGCVGFSYGPDKIMLKSTATDGLPDEDPACSLQSYLDEKASASELKNLTDTVSALSAKVDSANAALEEVV